jgi:hypothetical protein
MKESCMSRPRLLPFAAVLFVSVAAPELAAAQTVIVRSAPPGGLVEVVMGSQVLGTAKVDTLGDAAVVLKSFPRDPAPEMSTQVFVDVCGMNRRVVLVERSFDAPPVPDDCVRRAIEGFFVVRPISSLVIDVSEATPTLRLRQGPAPEAWLRHGPPPPPSLFASAPGLELFASANFVTFREAVGRACGTTRGCAGTDFTPSFGAGAAYWISPYFGVHAGYLRAGTVEVSGSGDGFEFDTTVDVEVLSLSGIGGVPLGRVRLYAMAGVNRHRSAAVTVETTDDVVVIEDGVPRTIAGGTETFVLNTSGFGWQFGGGLDVWVLPAAGFFIEAGAGPVKGPNRDAPEGRTDDHITYVQIGGRIRLSALLGR